MAAQDAAPRAAPTPSGLADWRRRRRERRQEKLYYASQGQLVWHGFKKHRLAVASLFGLAALYIMCIFADWFAPYGPLDRFKDFNNASPTAIHVFDENGALNAPFIYERVQTLDPNTFKYVYAEDKAKKHYLKLFVEAPPYRLLGLVPLRTKLFGTGSASAPLLIFGADRIGHDVFSRIIYGGRISLFIGLGGVALTFVLGAFLGGISGYYGGVLDEVIQRVIEVLISVPEIPLWIGLSAAMPKNWDTLQIYFALTLILAVRAWTGLARVVRGKIVSLREEEFALAAKAAGASDRRIIFVHLLPAFTSYLIVHITLAIPGMILGETALSFLGLGIQPPAVSWGTLLQDAQQITVLANSPWILWPAFFVVIAILMFNFVGDGLRDAADPYSSRW